MCDKRESLVKKWRERERGYKKDKVESEVGKESEKIDRENREKNYSKKVQ